MVHKIVGWFYGYVRFKIKGYGVERFVNLCHNKGIELWGISWNKGGEILYCYIRLGDFYKLRPLARKCSVMPVVIERYGMPFVIQFMCENKSFCTGIILFFMSLFFLSTRIWGISVAGENYHTKESILKYLNKRDIYGGMASKNVKCSKLKYDIRHSFEDIGWVSVELKGSKIYVRIKEVRLIKEKKKKVKGSLIAEDSGQVASIVVSSGTPKVIKGDKVKKGQVLISGIDSIAGDNDEIVKKRKVRAEGQVVIQSNDKYMDKLKIRYKKRTYTKRKKNLYEISINGFNIFLHNPLNDLETYKKCDIIREGGQLCPLLSLRFPVYAWRQSFMEVINIDSRYNKQEAEKILRERFEYYLEKSKKNGYKIVSASLNIKKIGDEYTASADVIKTKKQNKYKGMESDGNNGNSN